MRLRPDEIRSPFHIQFSDKTGFTFRFDRLVRVASLFSGEGVMEGRMMLRRFRLISFKKMVTVMSGLVVVSLKAGCGGGFDGQGLLKTTRAPSEMAKGGKI